MTKKLTLGRDYDKYNYDEERRGDVPRICSDQNNRKATVLFLRAIIEECGLTSKKKVSYTDYGETTQVWIKEFGGGYFLSATNSFNEAGGYEDVDFVDVEEFVLNQRNDYINYDPITYYSYKDAVENLAKDLNLRAGSCGWLKKGDAVFASHPKEKKPKQAA